MSRALLIIALAVFLVTTGCSQNQENGYLIKVYNGEYDEIGVECGYVNTDGDTVIPIGKYFYCYTDTLKDFAIVMDKNEKCIAIDKNENVLYEVYWYDNGPDYLSDGLFRIIKNGEIGYADKTGEIIINPQYECAAPFKNGVAKVALKCTLQKDGEHTRMESDEWFYINKKGKKIKRGKAVPPVSEVTIKGRFRSIKGVMESLSCYCYNGGYIATSQDGEIPVCFDDDEDIHCKQIMVKGYYTTEERKPDSKSPCPGGEKKFLRVKSYKCQ